MEKVFLKYATERKDMITADGVEKFSEDLGIDVMDVVWIPLSYLLGSKLMCQIPKAEFISGCKSLKINTISDFKRSIPSIRDKLKDETFFKVVYLFTFQFGKEESSRSMQLETAIALWELLFAYLPKEQLEKHTDFLKFLNSKDKKVKVISKDTWNLYLEFLKIEDISTFDLETSSWPLLIDQYVEWKNQNCQ
eukprot:NODE_27_length_39007_cov_1.590650.p22 type:complete len:193 gc:universal NODE_27_length_39007_cov_1.590650:37286-36708(-)